MKKIIALFLALILCLSVAPCAFANEPASTAEEIEVDGKYHAAEIIAALENKSSAVYASMSASDTILADVLMPVSMGITVPNIDASKVIQTVDVYTLDPSFAEALAAHGIYETSMTYSEYEALENTWPIPAEVITSAKSAYPELESVDMTLWTYGDYKEFCIHTDEANFLASITSEQLQELDSRDILVSDLSYLLKEYHTIDLILEQPNQDLMNIIEKAYTYTYEKLLAETQNMRAVPPSDQYTFVYFPRYNNGNGDYFLNSVLTTTYWQNVQADRTLKAQQCLYNSTSTTLCCTNMYGTYSYSQGGAHEGIDFVHPSGTSTPTIHAIFSGTKLSTSTSHQLSVYDTDSNLGARTYTYLHMNSITASNTVNVLDTVGKQGNQGNATGYHVHFEVHSGRTTGLSIESDHELGSITPYGMHEYTGCLTHTYEWTYGASYHWRECTVCGFTSAQTAHSYSNGKCITCGRIEDISMVNKNPTSTITE